MTLSIVIPTRFNRATVAPLIAECIKVARVVLVHTEPDHPDVPDTVTVRSDSRNIHTWWNLGLDTCTGPALALNDDVEATAAALAALGAELDTADLVYLDQRPGPNPLTGWCFGLHPDRIRPDEAFQWWYGDDDLYRRAVRDGLTIRSVRSKDIRHVRPTAQHFEDPAMRAVVDRDRYTFRDRWGD